MVLIPAIILTQKMLDRLSYSPEIRHGVLAEMADHRRVLQKETKPILESLRSYHDLPPVINSWLPVCVCVCVFLSFCK